MYKSYYDLIYYTMIVHSSLCDRRIPVTPASLQYFFSVEVYNMQYNTQSVGLSNYNNMNTRPRAQ